MGTDDSKKAAGNGPNQAVQIHIDQKPFQSPNPTTGDALYRLGHVKPGLWLYREVKGDREDPAIENAPVPVHLKREEHFHSGEFQGFEIIVEGTPHTWFESEISYTKVVILFDPAFPQHPDVTYSVTYDHGPHQNHEGILSPGGIVKVKEGMVFHVSRTGQS